MKKYFLLFNLILTIVYCQAQGLYNIGTNDKFIEVKVSDTLLVKADAMTLMVKLVEAENDDYKYDDYNYDEKDEEKQKRESQNKQKAKKLKVESILAKYKITDFKFHDAKKDKDLFSKDFSMYENAYEVKLGDAQLYEKLNTELSLIEDTKVSITELSVKDKHAQELLLIEKLMNKAKKEAQVIAKQMGTTLGNPLNVSNQSIDNMYTSMFNNTESMGGFGALFGMLGNMFNAAKQSTTVTISKSLVVRFAVGN
jgi:hypothetical protein